MAAAAFVAVAVGAAPSAAAATSDRILFASERDGNFELYAMNADGSSPTRLTFDPHDDEAPTTPASGARIAFARGEDIYVMDADGSNVKRLTRDAAADYVPSFSPDGSKIAFASYRGQNSDIYVMNADGSGRVSLTAGSGDDEWDPAWSPDGSKIAFARGNRAAFRGGDIYLMNADGSGTARLTAAENADESPAWSPDGRRIVFHRHRTTAGFLVDDSEIFVINADGSGEMQLTDTPPRPTGMGIDLSSSYPSWSPDGMRIAFARADQPDQPDHEIYVMNADGSGPRALTTNTARDRDPAFTPVPTAGPGSAPPGSAPLTGRTRLRPRRVTVAGRGRCRRRSRRILRCAVRLRGRVVRPAGPRASCAGGRVTATLRFGRRRVASVRTPTTQGCAYRVRKRFGLRTEGRVRRLSVAPRFGGNDYFSPSAGRRRKIRVRLAQG